MVYCGLARDNHGDEEEDEEEGEGGEEGEGEEDRESNEVFVGVDDARSVLIRETYVYCAFNYRSTHRLHPLEIFLSFVGITISRPVYRERVEEDTRSALSWARSEALVLAGSKTCRGNSRARPVWRSLTRWRHLCRRLTVWTGRSGGRGPAADPGAGGIEALRAKVSREGIDKVVRNG